MLSINVMSCISLSSGMIWSLIKMEESQVVWINSFLTSGIRILSYFRCQFFFYFIIFFFYIVIPYSSVVIFTFHVCCKIVEIEALGERRAVIGYGASESLQIFYSYGKWRHASHWDFYWIFFMNFWFYNFPRRNVRKNSVRDFEVPKLLTPW